MVRPYLVGDSIAQQNAISRRHMPVTQTSPAHEKIELFRSLFRGRAEVYPQRFESRKTGRSGYSPACGNEWVRGVCEKPRIKCSDCPHQRWLPVTDDVIRWHLSGADDHGKPFVMGVYPMLLDERCWFLAADFDGENWAADATAFLQTCGRLNIPAALERSGPATAGMSGSSLRRPFRPRWRASWEHTS